MVKIALFEVFFSETSRIYAHCFREQSGKIGTIIYSQKSRNLTYSQGGVCQHSLGSQHEFVLNILAYTRACNIFNHFIQIDW